MTATKAASTDGNVKSRRVLLAGALGGLGAWAAGAVGRASPVRAEGEIIHVGEEFDTATSRTRIRNQTNGSHVFMAQSTGNGIGLYGVSVNFAGVYGQSTKHRGVWGNSGSGSGVEGSSTSGVGVRGTSTSAQGVVGVGPIGVEGSSSNQSAWGVGGYNSAAGGTGVWGQANNGYAFRGVGRLRLDSVSGVATIAAGSTSKTVTPGVDVTSGSFVLLTPKANIGSRALWFTTNATDNKFTIRMSKTRSSNTNVAWLLLG